MGNIKIRNLTAASSADIISGNMVPIALDEDAGLERVTRRATFSQIVSGGSGVLAADPNSPFVFNNTTTEQVFKGGLTVPGNITLSGNLNLTGAISGNATGYFDSLYITGSAGEWHQITTGWSGVAGGGAGGKWTDGAGGDIYYNDGNVGIGTTDPLTALHLESDDNNTSVTSNNIRAITLQDTSSVNGALSQINFATSDNYGATQIGSRSTTNVPGDTVKAEIYFVTRDIDDGFTQKMVIKPDGGFVGIGTNSPDALLNVEGTSSDTDWTNISNLAGTAPSILITNTTNTANTFSAMQMIANEGSNNQSFAIVNQATTAGAGDRGSYSPKVHFAQRTASNTFTAAVTIDADANVGIGTGNPIGPLHVSNVSEKTINLTRDIDILGIANGAASKIEGGAMAGINPSMGAALGFALVDTDGAGVIGNTHGYLYFDTKDSGGSLTEKMRVTSEGNVGIGTTNPLSALHVSGDALIAYDSETNATGLVVGNYNHIDVATQTTALGFGLARDSATQRSNAGVITVGKELQWTDDDTHLDSYMSFSILDGMVSREKVRISSSGNFGIGTTTPQAPLDVVSTAGGLIMPRMTTAQMNAISAPSNGEMIYNTSSGKFAGYEAGAWQPLESSARGKYVADWATSHGGMPVAAGATMTITHNLGTRDICVSAYVNASASDVGADGLEAVINADAALTYGVFITSIIDANSFVLQLGDAGYVACDSNGSATATLWSPLGTPKYIKVVVIS